MASGWTALGWKRRWQFYDRTAYFPPTCRTPVDGRLQFNLCEVYLGKGRSMDRAQRTEYYEAARQLFSNMFPAFRTLRIAQSWSGGGSIPFNVKPQIGTVKGDRVSYAFGY